MCQVLQRLQHSCENGLGQSEIFKIYLKCPKSKDIHESVLCTCMSADSCVCSHECGIIRTEPR